MLIMLFVIVLVLVLFSKNTVHSLEEYTNVHTIVYIIISPPFPQGKILYTCLSNIVTHSLGSWSSPSVRGSRPPPCSGFSLTMIDEEHAVMFGGELPALHYSAGVYVLHLPTMVSSLLQL